MDAPHYVCLSDLHLGAAYSVLTRMGADGSIDLHAPSAALTALGTGLRGYLRQLNGGQPARLVLLGDVLDLGQSPVGDVSHGFRRFVEAMFPPGEPAVFSDQVLLVPGNHDRVLWRAAQDARFLQQLPAITDHLPESTALFDPGPFGCGLMTELMRGYPNLRQASVQVAYPNFALHDEARRRCVVLHHGHYCDATCLVMSTLNARLHSTLARPASVAEVARQNGPWTDFLFSGLGGGGDVGKDVVTLYQSLRDAAASHQLARQLATGLLDTLADQVGIGPQVDLGRGITVADAVQAALDVSLVRNAAMERDAYATVMSDDGIALLRWYIGGPVRHAIGDAGKLDTADTLSFVFGHTHKPFQDELAVPGIARPVALYNTGGWVMDQPTRIATQGAAAVLIDDQLNVASLRLYNDPVNGVRTPVAAAGLGGSRDGDNPLLARMREALEATREGWAPFTEAAAAATELHAAVLLQEFFKENDQR